MIIQPVTFALNPRLDQPDLTAQIRAAGRIQIPDFLEPSGANALLDHLQCATDWVHVLNAGDKVYEIASEQMVAMSAKERAALDQKVDREAAKGFQFRFDTIRAPDDERERASSKQLIVEFAQFLSSRPVIDWFRAVTGCERIDFADCQATRYTQKAFLTRHDDKVDGKRRHFAYVLGLTRDWREEWGGLLLFPQKGAMIVEALVPQYNVLTLFEVGQPHSVSQVATYAPAPRFSVTGWLRSRR